MKITVNIISFKIYIIMRIKEKNYTRIHIWAHSPNNSMKTIVRKIHWKPPFFLSQIMDSNMISAPPLKRTVKSLLPGSFPNRKYYASDLGEMFLNKTTIIPT